MRLGVDDGARTRDPLDHNQVLYRLSYNHRTCPRQGRSPEAPFKCSLASAS